MKGQVLLIDDSQLDLKVATSVLEIEGYACHGFMDYKEALVWIETNKPQVIFLDLQMPEITGYDLIPILKKHKSTKDVPIVIMSGKNEVEDIKKAIVAGVNDYLIKPIDAMVVQEKLNKISASASSSEYGAVQVPSKFLENVGVLRSIEVQLISEFGFRARASFEIEPGDTVELGGFPFEDGEREILFARCLSTGKDPQGKNFVMQFTFVGTKESQRQKIRKMCLQLWVINKGEAV